MPWKFVRAKQPWIRGKPIKAKNLYGIKYHSLSFDFEGSAHASQFDVAQTTARALHFDSQQPPP